MKLASLMVVVGICASAVTLAAGKKDFRAEPSRSPHEQSEEVQRARSLIESKRNERLHLSLELAGIDRADIVNFIKTATDEQRQQLAKMIGDLTRADDYIERQEAIREIRIRLGLLVPKPEAHPEIYYDPADSVETRREAMRFGRIEENINTFAAWQHVAKHDSDAEVRSLAHARTRLQTLEEYLRLSTTETP